MSDNKKPAKEPLPQVKRMYHDDFIRMVEGALFENDVRIQRISYPRPAKADKVVTIEYHE